MNVFVEGPCWVGRWTEIIVDTLRASGHHVDFSYHNRKSARDRLALAGQMLLHGGDRRRHWQQRQRRRLLTTMQGHDWDILFSIQGHVDAATATRLRTRWPRLKIVYWWGDVLHAAARTRLQDIATCADRILLSYHGSCTELQALYGDRVQYFPFGVAPAFHTPDPLTAHELRRYSADVALVGTCYPERCELVRFLNTRLDRPVAVWGRGWRRCRGIRHHGPLSLADSLKVYRCARISLNLHHAATANGFNMKYYEIPAAGGFQLCDWQPLMDTPLDCQQTVACRTHDDFAAAIRNYLADDAARERIRQHNRQAVRSATLYAPRLEALLAGLA